MWSDIESKIDFLNYSEASEIIINVLQNPQMLPISIGVFGSWGTGKSTILNLIENNLEHIENHDDYVIIRFDAWLYQGFDDARASLLEVINTEISKLVKQDEKLYEKALSIGKRINKLRALGWAAEGTALAFGVPTFGLLSKAIDSIGNGINGSAGDEDAQHVTEAINKGKESLKDILNEEKSSAPKEITALKNEFEDLLASLNKRVIVFVDNLDRCLPKQTIETLESLRLFLFMKNTAFVIAADEEMVRFAVKDHFNGIDERHITDYLDKLIQFPVKVPRISTREVRAYLFLLYASIHPIYGKQQEKLESLRKGLESNLRLSWKDDPIKVNDALALLDAHAVSTQNLATNFYVSDRIAHLLAENKYIEGNPRIVKRMLNVISTRQIIASARQMPIDISLITKMALFERCCNSKSISYLYNLINSSSDGKPKILEELEELTNDVDGFKGKLPKEWEDHYDFLLSWFGLEPKFKNVNLRPLVYLSKETVPLRTISKGLSSDGESAFNTLLKITNTSSQAAQQAIGNIPVGEETLVMDLILSELNKHNNWESKPNGFTGAFLLAKELEDTRPQFISFMNTAMVEKTPWFNLMMKKESWFPKN
ncbi:KAP family P-loop NTPase fold protein [Acinetobacter towneri]|uniref:KAP family P-loop NTPase fold protein n=1 Tax=Acinetobacter towneri TaxID=202956 RepID=UPI002934B9A1|nr:P-loop NTPase fold protein [Acinetobacter towneri]WOE27406.1 P-loop NTPase fold protein [Acinetobacter towneri]